MHDKIAILDEILPNIKRYIGETFIIYYDGQPLYNHKLADKFAHDIVLMKQMGINIIVVHGGNEILDDFYKKFNITHKYIDDNRIIDKDSVVVAEMVMTGFINKRIVQSINNAGGSAIGISGKDTNLIEAKKYRKYKTNPNSNVENIIDLGFIGEPTIINPDILLSFEDGDFIPVISPIAIGEQSETFYVDPFTAAAVISSSLIVKRMIIMNDIDDILALYKKGSIIEYQDFNKFQEEISGKNKKLRPFLSKCWDVLQNKIDSINIVDGKIPHSLIIDLFTYEKSGIIINNMNRY